MLGDLIKNGRIKKKLRQQDLADKLGTTKNTVFLWEKGVSIPSGDMLIKIAQELEIIEELFRPVPEKPPPDNNCSGLKEEIEDIKKEQAQIEKYLHVIADKLNISINIHGNGNLNGNNIGWKDKDR